MKKFNIITIDLLLSKKFCLKIYIEWFYNCFIIIFFGYNYLDFKLKFEIEKTYENIRLLIKI